MNIFFLVKEDLKENFNKNRAWRFIWEFFNILRNKNKALKILDQVIQNLATFFLYSKSIKFYALIPLIQGSCKFLTVDLEDT